MLIRLCGALPLVLCLATLAHCQGTTPIPGPPAPDPIPATDDAPTFAMASDGFFVGATDEDRQAIAEAQRQIRESSRSELRQMGVPGLFPKLKLLNVLSHSVGQQQFLQTTRDNQAMARAAEIVGSDRPLIDWITNGGLMEIVNAILTILQFFQSQNAMLSPTWQQQFRAARQFAKRWQYA